MSNKQPPLWLRYGGAVLAVVLATLLRALLNPVLGNQAPFLVYFGAIMFATWYSGRGPGVMVLGLLLANYLFVTPYGSLDGFNTLDLVRFGLYAATGLMVVALTDSLHESRVRAEAALRAREAQLQAIIDNSSAIVYAKDRAGRYILANRGYEQLLGLGRAAILGKTDYELHPGEVAESFAANDRAALAADRPLEFEEAGVFADGVRTYLSLKFPLPDANGVAYAVCGISADITERKRAEEERERLLQQLAEADRRKDEFLATLAHELRNPLAPISNALQLIKRGAGRPGAVDDALAMAERQLVQLVRLVDDLLDVARITRGKIALHKTRITLQAIIENALETSRPLIEGAGHRLTVELPAAPVALEADPTRLAQAVSNLLINAAKYTAAGGHIRLAARCEDQELVIAVQDTGIGIPQAQLPRVFELFAQGAVPAARRAHDGLGIGLALVKSLVELHGGRVAAASAGPGQGSTFTIRLLLVGSPAPAEAAGASEAPTPSPSPPSRILVVDDDADVANSLALLLETCGYAVCTAYDGASALEEARVFQPGAVLLDIGMPGMDGLEVARRLRQAPELQGILLIALTGWGQEADRRRSQAAGFDHHLVKPVDVEALEALLSGNAIPLNSRQPTGTQQP